MTLDSHNLYLSSIASVFWIGMDSMDSRVFLWEVGETEMLVCYIYIYVFTIYIRFFNA